MRLILFAAAMIGAASATTTNGMAQCLRTSIPTPNPALLTPPSEFDCEFKTSSLNEPPGQPQPSATRGQTDPAAEAAALVAKLDYERQCYRHARTIVHDRLRQLQASVDKTMKVVNRACPAARTGRATGLGSTTSIPLPGRALLAEPANVDCEFKDSSLDDAAGGAPQPTPTRAQADAALRVKLDYERQCYRHDEMILRNGLQLLQASVGEMIKAVNRNELRAAKQQTAAKQQAAAKQQRPADRSLRRAQVAPCAAISRGKCVGRDPDAHVRFMILRDSSL